MGTELKLLLSAVISLLVMGIVYALGGDQVASWKNSAAYSSAIAKDSAVCLAPKKAIVVDVIDGDTLIVEGGAHVRLIGIDAEEVSFPCFGYAKNRLEELVMGKEISLERDVTDTDQYKRCLRTVFLENENINVKLVREGLVAARFYPPNVKYMADLTTAEMYAMENNIGCKWANN